jgi:DNA-binding transcriptional MocR family regulator
MANAYKSKKRGAGRHVQLSEWLQVSEAWATLKPGPRALYIELKRRFNGANNGEIFLSHRDAALALNVNRNTATEYFRELAEREFITMTMAPHLGVSGIGKASKWALQEEPTRDGKPALKGFMRWAQKQNPRPKNRTPRPEKWDTRYPKTAEPAASVPKNGTHLAGCEKRAS